jgi:hypothetical protein
VILPGNWQNATSTTTIKKSLAIRCDSGSTIPLSGTGPLLQYTGSVGEDSGITIEGCTLSGGGATAVAISLTNVTNVRISRNSILNFKGQGITGAGWNNVEIDQNRFTNVGQVNANDGAIYLLPGTSTNVRVHHNSCDNSAQQTGCFKFTASSAGTLTDIDVSDNDITVGDAGTIDTLGIELFSTDSNDSDIQQFTIANNRIAASNSTNTNVFCISLGGARNGVVSGNSVKNCNAFGIEVIASYTSIVANTLDSTGPITWNAAAAAHAGVVITGNSILTSTGVAGIQLYQATSSSNFLQAGIISNNIFTSPAQAAIVIQPSIGNTILEIRISDNIFNGNTSGRTAIVVYGTSGSAGVSQISIEANRFTNINGAGAYGLSLASGGRNFAFRNNYFTGNAWLSNAGATVVDSYRNIVNGVCCQ